VRKNPALFGFVTADIAPHRARALHVGHRDHSIFLRRHAGRAGGRSSLVLDYKSALAKYFPGDAPDYVSLEGYVDATALIAALQHNGPELDTERLVGTLENLRDLDLGLGTPVTFSRSDHQGVHKVWGTQFDETGHYQPIDLQ
jgi:branched-chain amino acid transport system substrate-binding protein